MNDAALIELADLNYFEAFHAMTLANRGPVLEADGVLCVATGLPAAFMNVAFVTRPPADPGAALKQAVAFFDGLGLPFVVRVREGVDAGAERAAEGLGMPYSDTVPGMALFPVPAPSPSPPGLAVDVVRDDAGLAAFQEVLAAGFSMPLEFARALVQPRTLEATGFEFYLGVVDGRPVATSTLYRHGRTAGVYNVATLDTYRRRGLGEAMTWHAVARGVEAGADIGVLQASEMGRPVYERMGFRLVAPYRTFHRPG